MYSLISNFNMHKIEVDKVFDAVMEKSAWMSSWNVHHSFSSPWRVRDIVKTASYLPGAVKELESQARRVLPHFISNASTSEWIEQNIGPLVTKLDTLATIEQNLTQPNVWPRGPIL